MKTLLKITKSDLMQSVIFSDLHKNHRNVCKGTTKWSSGYRNFENPEQMWNNFKIQLDELKKTHNRNLFFLGDFSFIGKTKWIEELYEICLGFHKIYFIYGNHDEIARENSNEIQKLFLERGLDIEFRDYLELKITEGKFLEYEVFEYKNEHDEVVPYDKLLIDFYKKEIVKKTTTNICMFHLLHHGIINIEVE
jgi:UDP-2,3-diacylglucosamine pyrophosphatase LpxH